MFACCRVTYYNRTGNKLRKFTGNSHAVQLRGCEAVVFAGIVPGTTIQNI